MYDSLLRRAQADYTPEASMAETWSVSDDGLTWTFHLRDGLTWSDGEPITAEDFAWTGNFIAEQRHQLLERRLPVHRHDQGDRRPDDRVDHHEAHAGAGASRLQPAAARARLGQVRRQVRPHGAEVVPQLPRSRRLGPLPARGVGAGPVLAAGGPRRLLGRPARHRRARLPGLQLERVRRAGAAEGGDRLHADPHREPLRSGRRRRRTSRPSRTAPRRSGSCRSTSPTTPRAPRTPPCWTPRSARPWSTRSTDPP